MPRKFVERRDVPAAAVLLGLLLGERFVGSDALKNANSINGSVYGKIDLISSDESSEDYTW